MDCIVDPKVLVRALSRGDVDPLAAYAEHPASLASYCGGVQASARGQVRQWLLLLCTLIVALVGMHHIAFTQHEPQPGGTHAAAGMPATTGAVSAATMEQPEAHCPGPAPGGGHDTLHPCDAVLHVSGGLLLLVLLVAVGAGVLIAAPTGLRLPAWRPYRPPGTAGRSLLASVCVLRI